METDADGSGDGMANLDPALLDAAREAEIYLGYGVPAALLREGRELRWVHSGAAGVRGSLTPEMLASRVLFTNSRGIHGPPMADTALGMILHFSRGLDFGIAAKARGRWEKDPFYAADNPLVELAFSTVGVFGVGKWESGSQPWGLDYWPSIGAPRRSRTRISPSRVWSRFMARADSNDS
jgi:phosphoglycerate dehydrogenase-like enzyme